SNYSGHRCLRLRARQAKSIVQRQPPGCPPSTTRGKHMPEARYDVIAIGNAIVDVMAPCSDDLIEEFGMARGAMTLVDEQQAAELYDAMGPAREISGGSAANTLAGLSALGAQCAFIGQVADD